MIKFASWAILAYSIGSVIRTNSLPLNIFKNISQELNVNYKSQYGNFLEISD